MSNFQPISSKLEKSKYSSLGWKRSFKKAARQPQTTILLGDVRCNHVTPTRNVLKKMAIVQRKGKNSEKKFFLIFDNHTMKTFLGILTYYWRILC